MTSESLNLLTVLRAQNAPTPACSHFWSFKWSTVYTAEEEMSAKEIDDATEFIYSILEKYGKHPQILEQEPLI